MANLSVTATQVLPSTTATIKNLIAGEAMTAGQLVYKKASDNKAYLAQADGTAAEAVVLGIVVGPAVAATQRCSVQCNGTVTIGAGASVTAGAAYFLSATAGAICPVADLTTDDYVTYIGTANGSNQIVLNLHASGVQHV